MPSPTVKIIVEAVDNATKVIKNVSVSSEGLESTAQKANRSMAKLGLGISGAAVAMAAFAGAKKAVDVAADFEEQMNLLTLQSGEGADMLETLRQAAIQTGADTELVGVSAAQSAEAMINFYKAGLTTADVFGGPGGLNAYLEGTASLSGALRAAIDLQAASELELADATDTITVAMSTFGISAEDATEITNNFVKAADASVTSVPELNAAMKNLGSTWSAYYSASLGPIGAMEDMNTALALLSQYGINGAEAGTALKSMMTNLQRPTDSVKDTLNELGVSLYDANGQMRRLPDIIQDLQEGLEGATEEQRNMAIQTLAGTYGMKAMNALMKEGASGWQDMEQSIERANSAQAVANARTQGLNAAFEVLGGSIETFLIVVGTPMLGVLTKLVLALADGINVLTDFALWMQKLPEHIDAAKASISAFADAGRDMVRGLAAGITQGASDAIGAILGLAATILDTVKSFFGISSPSVVLTGIGIELGNGLVLGFSQSITLSQDQFLAALGVIKATFAGIDLVAQGLEIAQGLITGLSSFIAEIGPTITIWKDAIVGKIKAFFQISSPSKVMLALGLAIARGFALGLAEIATITYKLLSNLENLPGRLSKIGDLLAPGPLSRLAILMEASAIDIEGIITSVTATFSSFSAEAPGPIEAAIDEIVSGFTKLGTQLGETVQSLPAIFSEIKADPTAGVSSLLAVIGITDETNALLTNNLVGIFEHGRNAVQAFAKGDFATGIRESFATISLFKDLKINVIQGLFDIGRTILDNIGEAFPSIQPYIDDFLVPLLDTGENLIVAWDTLNKTLKAARVTVITGALEKLPQLLKAAQPILTAVIKEVGELVTAISADVVPFLQGIMGEAATFIVDKIGIVVDWITENEPLITGAIDNLSNIWNGAWPIMEAAFTTAWNLIKGSLSTMIDTILKLGEVVLAIISGDWTKAWDSFKQAISTIAVGAFSQIEALLLGFETIVNKVIGIFTGEEGNWQGITKAITSFKENWTKAWPLISSAFTTVWDALKKTFADFKMVLDGIIGIGKSLAEGDFLGAFSSFTDVIAGIGKLAWDTITGGIKGILDILSALITLLTGGDVDIAETISSAIKSVWDALTSVPAEAGDVITDVLTGIWEALTGVPSDAAELVGELASGFWGILSGAFSGGEGETGGISGVIDSIRSNIVEAMSKIKFVIGDMKDLATKVWDAFKAAFSEDGVIGSALSSIWGVIKGLFTGEKNLIEAQTEIQKALVGMIEKVIAAIVEYLGLTETLNTIKSAMTGAIIAGRDAILEKVSDFTQAGKDLITGLADGLKARADSYLKEKAEGVANLLPGWVKKMLGISSPSKVFMDIGENIIEGLSIPIAEGSGPLQDSFSGVMGVFNAIVGWLTRFAIAVGEKGLETAGETFEDIADGIEDMANAFNAFAEGAARVKSGGLDRGAMVEYLDQWAWAAGEAVRRVKQVVEDVGWKTIGRMKGRATRLATILKSVTADLSKLKPGDLNEINAYFDQFFTVMPMVMRRLVAMITDPETGIGQTVLDDLGVWSEQIAATFVLMQANFESIKPGEAETFITTVSTYLDQVFEFAKGVRDRVAKLNPQDLVDAEEAAKAVPALAGSLQLIGKELEIELPEPGWEERLPTYLNMAFTAIAGIREKVGDILAELKKTTEGEATDVLKEEAAAAQSLQSMLGLLGQALNIPDMTIEEIINFPIRFQQHLMLMAYALGDAKGGLVKWLGDVEKEWGQETLDARSKIAEALGPIFNLLGQSTEIKDEGTEDFPTRFQAFLGRLSLALGDAKSGLMAWLGTIKDEWGQEALDAYKQVAETLGPIFDVLNLSKTFQEITRQKEEDVTYLPFDDVVDNFIARLKTASTKFKAALPEIARIWGDSLQPAKDLVTLIAEVFGQIADALASIDEIASGKNWGEEPIANGIERLSRAMGLLGNLQGLNLAPATAGSPTASSTATGGLGPPPTAVSTEQSSRPQTFRLVVTIQKETADGEWITREEVFDLVNERMGEMMV